MAVQAPVRPAGWETVERMVSVAAKGQAATGEEAAIVEGPEDMNKIQVTRQRIERLQ